METEKSKETKKQLAIVPIIPIIEDVVKRAAIDVKRQLAAANIGSSFELDINCSGSIHSGDLKIEFSLSDQGYPLTRVIGCKLSSVVAEFLRRKGWNKTNTPLLISHKEQDDIPS